MARRFDAGDVALKHAMAQLIQNQAALIQNHVAFAAQSAEASQRFARIERDLEQIKVIVQRHEQLLAELPELIQRMLDELPRKIGFRTQAPRE